jgi:hypothetical protein
MILRKIHCHSISVGVRTLKANPRHSVTLDLRIDKSHSFRLQAITGDYIDYSI